MRSGLQKSAATVLRISNRCISSRHDMTRILRKDIYKAYMGRCHSFQGYNLMTKKKKRSGRNRELAKEIAKKPFEFVVYLFSEGETVASC